MQDIYIDKVYLNNVRGYTTPMEMDFPVDNFTCFVGKNGAGKSTIFKAISMALYGDDGSVEGERLSVADMVNNKIKKDLEIFLDFRIVENNITDKYRIELYQNHKRHKNEFKLTKNGIDISGENKTATYDFIEKLLIPRSVYHNTVYFSQQVKDFFTSLVNSKQKQIFDSILSTQDYTIYYNNTLKVIKELTEKLNLIDSNLSNVGVILQVKKDQTLTNLQKNKEVFLKEMSDKVSLLTQQRIDKEVLIQILTDEISEKVFDQKQLDLIREKLFEYQEKQRQNNSSRQNNLTTLETEFKSKLEKIHLQLISSKENKINDIRNQDFHEKELLNEKILAILQKLNEVEKEFDVSHLHIDNQKFHQEKQKETNIVNQQIHELDLEFSTDSKRSEWKDRIVIIDKNIDQLKNEASQIKEKVATFKSQILEKENVVKEDEEKLNQKVPICSKCLRPFSGPDGGSVIKDSISKTKKEIDDLYVQIDLAKNQMSILKTQYDETLITKTNTDISYSEQIENIQKKKSEKLEILDRKRNLIQCEIINYKKSIDEKITDIQNKKMIKQNNLIEEKQQFESQIQEIAYKIDSKILEIEKSYTIELQNYETEHNKKYTISCSDINQKYDTIGKEIDKEVFRLQEEVNSLSNLQNLFTSNQNRLQILRNELKNILDRINENRDYKYDDSQIDKIRSEIENHEKELLQLIEVKKGIQKEISILEFWKSAFSDSGIKSMLIDMAIPHMNESVAEALDKVAPGVFTLSFDTLKTNKSGDVKDKFNVNILHNLKGTNSHKMLSGGEKRLVDLCCMDAIRSLSENLYNKRFHNLFYDEVLDSLDDDSCQAFGQALKRLATNKNITLITHKVSENIEPDRVFNF